MDRSAHSQARSQSRTPYIPMPKAKGFAAIFCKDKAASTPPAINPVEQGPYSSDPRPAVSNKQTRQGEKIRWISATLQINHAGSLPGRHLILQPIEGSCSCSGEAPFKRAATARFRSAPSVAMLLPGRLSSIRPR